MNQSKGSVRELYVFPEPTFIENIACRPNGHLLLTTFRGASLYDIDPDAQDPKPELVAQLPGVNRLTGIVQISPDVFAITGGNREKVPFSFHPGSAKLFTIDMRPGIGSAIVKKLADVVEAQILNGMVGLPENPHILLSVDSISGRVFRFNTDTAAVDIVFQDTLLTPSGEPGKVPIGVNGVKIRDGFLYFTNSSREIYIRVKIGPKGDKVGELDIIFANKDPDLLMAFDDFDLDDGGNTYVTVHPNAIYKISPDGQHSLFAGGDKETLKNPTSLLVKSDVSKAYIVTAGDYAGLSGKVTGG